MPNSPERRLAAILVADMVGYSQLIERDEAGTVARLKSDRVELIDATIADHGGRIVRLAGDGALVEFPSVVEAAQCAIDIQRGMPARNAERREDQQIVFRMGVNLGDIIVEDDNLHGEGINVAARLESLSEPGGILLSQEAARYVEGKIDAELEFVEERTVKNIERPVRIFRVVLKATGKTRTGLGWAKWRFKHRAFVTTALLVSAILVGGSYVWLSQDHPWGLTQASAPKSEEADLFALPNGPSVAVLPFQYLSTDTDRAFVADGMTEEITAALSLFQGLRVVARTSTAAYKDRSVDVRTLGDELGADYAVEGSVQLAGDTVRVTAQLVSTDTGDHLWSEAYEGALTAEQLFSVQAEIAAKVSAAVASPHGGAIAITVRHDVSRRAPEHLSSYECVLTSGVDNLGLAATQRAITCLTAAVQRDPQYADAWASLSRTYRVAHVMDHNIAELSAKDLDGKDLLDLSLDAGQRAVELAPDSAAGHFALAESYFFLGEIDRFRVEADRALELNPNEPSHLGILGNHLAYSGLWDKGRRLAEKGIGLNPNGYQKWWWFAAAKDHFRKGEYEEALEFFHRSFYPKWWISHLHYVHTYAQLGEMEKARQALAELQRLRPGTTIADAVALQHTFNFEMDYIDEMVEGLRKAGMPEGNPPS